MFSKVYIAVPGAIVAFNGKFTLEFQIRILINIFLSKKTHHRRNVRFIILELPICKIHRKCHVPGTPDISIVIDRRKSRIEWNTSVIQLQMIGIPYILFKNISIFRWIMVWRIATVTPYTPLFSPNRMSVCNVFRSNSLNRKIEFSYLCFSVFGLLFSPYGVCTVATHLSISTTIMMSSSTIFGIANNVDGWWQ